MKILLCFLYVLFTTATHSQEIQWTPFVWYSDTVGGKVRPKLALLLPCTLKGVPRKLLWQFDTGSNASVIQEGPRRQFHLPVIWADSNHAFTFISTTLGTLHIDSLRISIDRHARDTLTESDAFPNIGTIGEDILVGKVCILDFPRNRFAILDSMSRMPDYLLTRVSYVPMNRRNDKLFVTIQLGDTVSDSFFFDTGSSMFPISTTKALWQTLTGHEGHERSLLRVPASSWGQEIVMIGAPIRGEVRFGDLRVQNAMAYFDSTRPTDFAEYPFKTDGLIGNALFYDEYLVVIDMIKNRFGIMKE